MAFRAAMTSTLGVTRPLRESVTSFPVAFSVDSICAGVSNGFFCSRSAAVAAAVGEACDVP